MSKVLVVYATAGIGHKKAAIAVKSALDEIAPKGVETTLIDSLDHTPRFFKWSYLQLYLLAVNRLASVWGSMYYITDNYYVNLVVRYIRRIGNWMNSGRLRRYLIAMDPDVVVSTHFFASEIIADMKRNGKLARTTLVTVVTDYRLHSWWVAEGTDIYVVAGEDAKKDLIDWHVPAERIMVMGIPIEMVFSRPTDKERIRSSFGLRESLPTVLIIGGGFGVGPIEDIVKAVTAIPKDLQVVVICGHNEELRERISRLTPSPNIRLKAFGFVNNVHEFMSVADLLISKSGGITVSEALARELPLVIIAPIPGQETRNSEVLRRHGAAVEARELEVLKKAVEDLVGDPGRLAAMREAIRSLRRPDASLDVAKLALSKIKK